MGDQVFKGKSQEVYTIRTVKERTLGINLFIRVSPPSTSHAMRSILNDALIKDPESYRRLPWMPVDPNIGVAQLLGAVFKLKLPCSYYVQDGWASFYLSFRAGG